MKFDSETRFIAVGLTVLLVLILGVFILLPVKNSVAGAVPVQQESATTCTALGADTYIIIINDDRIHAPAKALADGLKKLLDENPNKKIKDFSSVERVCGAGSTTQAIIVVLE